MQPSDSSVVWPTSRIPVPTTTSEPPTLLLLSGFLRLLLPALFRRAPRRGHVVDRRGIQRAAKANSVATEDRGLLIGGEAGTVQFAGRIDGVPSQAFGIRCQVD